MLHYSGNRLQMPDKGASAHAISQVLAVPSVPRPRRLPPPDHLRGRPASPHRLRGRQSLRRPEPHVRGPGDSPALRPRVITDRNKLGLTN